jgi:eukaryotic-like serine/threonine-protein kinase
MGDDRAPTLRIGAAAPESPRDPAPAQRIGSWIVGARLGGGGFGDVHEARHHATDQPAALKILHAHFTASPEMLARFDREVQVLTRLRHPSIVHVIDAGFADDGRPYLCMELLRGRDLAATLRARGSLELAETVRILEPLCDALAFAHDRGIVHRDLKASNVFGCEPGDRVVLLDFGIAKLSDALAPELTASHQSLGTPGCMAPEQVHGGRVDAQTDVYALGGLVYHMLTGRLAFQDPSETMTQYLHLHARRPRASALASVAPSVDDVIVRAMAIESGNRFDGARAVAAALRTAARGSRAHAAVTTGEHAAIYLMIADRTAGAEVDEALIGDLEAVLPLTERALASHGFALVLDLGTSAMFLQPHPAIDAAIRAALAAWDQLERRPTRDRRVQIGLCVHRGPATVTGDRVEPCPLLRPETWPIPDPLEGVWVTAALEPAARRLR